MMTKSERSAAYKNYRTEIVDGRIYAVATIDYGSKPSEIRIQDMYQRLASETGPIGHHWYGTALAADRAYEARRSR